MPSARFYRDGLAPASSLSAPTRRSLGGRLGRRFEEPDQLADGVVAVLGVPQRQVFVHLVMVSAPVADLRQVAGFHQVVDDLCRRSLGDPNDLGDVSEANGWVAGDRLEHVRVVRDEAPAVVAVT
jgi:hypothetical protein